MPFITICIRQEHIIVIFRVNIQFQALGVWWLFMRIFSDNMTRNFATCVGCSMCHSWRAMVAL